MASRLLFASDLHYSGKKPVLGGNGNVLYNYGETSDERITAFRNLLLEEHRKEPIEALFLLGDVSHENLQNLKELYAKYICGLPFPVYTIPGNHEPYQSEDWVRITGNPRQFTVETKEFHVILLDRYSNPEYLHQIQPADISFIEQELRSANGKPILLCAHFFKKETDAKLEELLLDQPKIRLLLMGHTHDKESILTETFGGKSVVDTGNFSYALNVPENCTDFVLRHGWSITELKKEGTALSVRRIYPDWQYPLNHLPQENYLHYYGSYSDCQSVHSYGDWIKVCESSF